MNIGDKIKMDEEVQRYTVQAVNEDFAIMTKPFNARRTYLYTIVDFKRKIRGPSDLLFGPCYELNTQEGAAAFLRQMGEEHLGVSRRHVPLTDKELEQVML